MISASTAGMIVALTLGQALERPRIADTAAPPVVAEAIVASVDQVPLPTPKTGRFKFRSSIRPNSSFGARRTFPSR